VRPFLSTLVPCWCRWFKVLGATELTRAFPSHPRARPRCLLSRDQSPSPLHARPSHPSHASRARAKRPLRGTSQSVPQTSRRYLVRVGDGRGMASRTAQKPIRSKGWDGWDTISLLLCR
jgi:hypothetical protein